MVQEIKYHVSFARIPSQIDGNEMDDRLAKEALQLKRINFLVFPCFLDNGKSGGALKLKTDYFITFCLRSLLTCLSLIKIEPSRK